MTETLAEAGYLEEIEIHGHAEDVKAVKFIGDRGAVEVSVTDETMFEGSSLIW